MPKDMPQTDWDAIGARDHGRISIMKQMLELGINPDALAALTAAKLADLGWTIEDMKFYIERAQARIDAEGC